MKYLEEKRLLWINSILSNCEIGDRILHGRVDSFSCKKASSDKKLAKNLDLHYLNEILLTSSEYLGTSPIGSLADSSTRKLLINLISTMNASFPDYDFTNTSPDNFKKENNVNNVIHLINNQFGEMIELQSQDFLKNMWKSIDKCIHLKQCTVYSYIPDMETDPFSDRTLYLISNNSIKIWSFNYFFHNSQMKKILYFTCVARKLCSTSSDEEELDEVKEKDNYDDDDESCDFMGIMDWEDGA